MEIVSATSDFFELRMHVKNFKLFPPILGWIIQMK